jgi:hypothetical protein
MIKRLSYLLLFFAPVFTSLACQCPLTTLSLKECDRYQLIFKGRVDSVIACGDNNMGEAIIIVDELYKGVAMREFRIAFDCKDPCFQGFNAGEEWIIYTDYRQMNAAKMDWCSRSRKFFRIAKEDYYTATYGNDYDEELKFLRSNLGLHRVKTGAKNASEGRNIRPSNTQTVIMLLCSLGGILLFYWLFRKFFKS